MDIRHIYLAFIFMIGVSLVACNGCEGGGGPRFEGDSAFVYLEQQCDLGPRFPGSPGHRALQRYIIGVLEQYGANVSLQPFEAVLTTGDTLRLVNIIANYNRDAKRRIMFGAHYDTRPRADRDPDPAKQHMPIPGANDGASGVAVLLEFARLFDRVRPPIGVDLVFFDGEDYGEDGVSADYILGSAHFALNLKNYRPSAVIIVDMVGERDVEIKVEAYSAAYSALLVDDIFTIAERLGVDAFKRTKGYPLIDDHLPFIRAGIPAIVLIDFDYPYWHTLDDTPDKCESESLGAVGSVLVEYIWGFE
jgi:glutaminyl-peptide cyclotransferase